MVTLDFSMNLRTSLIIGIADPIEHAIRANSVFADSFQIWRRVLEPRMLDLLRILGHPFEFPQDPDHSWPIHPADSFLEPGGIVEVIAHSLVPIP
jgi:hypothetical protein